MTRARRSRQVITDTIPRRVVVVIAFCAVLLGVEGAHAATVAILSSGSTPAIAEATSRLRGELFALQLRVLILRPPTRPDLGVVDRRAWLEQAADTHGIDAVIEVVGESAPEAVDVWIFQHSPRRSQVARVELDANAPDRAGILAIRAIEVLRSYRLEADLAARGRAREAPAAASGPPATATGVATEEASADRDPGRPWSADRAGVELGAGVLTGLGGVGPALLPVLRFDWRAHPALLLHATVSGLGTRPTLRAAEGNVRVAQSYGALGICYCPAWNEAVSPYFSVGAGASHTSLTGRAQSPAQGHSLEQWALLLDVGAGARLRLSQRYYATFTGHLQLTQPSVAIHVVDERLASTGRPNLLANVMLGTWL